MHLIQEIIGLPTIKKDDKGENIASFVISPLPNGYGTTLGNSLRRILLSSLPGAAVTGIKIKGKNYEYSTIEGARDSVLQILLNLKKVKFKKNSSDASILELKADKEGNITAGDIKTPSDVEVLNPEQIITTVEKGSTLEMLIKVEKGVGYLTAQEKKESETEIDWIWTDAFFSPVKKVQFKAEDTRVGQMTNLDKVSLEIETDGSITPENALKFSANLAQSYFQLFNHEKVTIESEFMSDVDKITSKQEEEENQKPVKETYTPIEILGLSPRTLNALINGEIGSIEQLIKCTESKLTNLRGFGKKALTEVRDALAPRGLTLAND